MVTIADHGRFKIREGERDLVLYLEDGLIHLQSSTKNYRTISFEKFYNVFRPPQMVPEKKRWTYLGSSNHFSMGKF